MVLLDLYRLLFSGLVAGERLHERVRDWRERCPAGARSRISFAGFARVAARCGGAQYPPAERREMAAECRRRRHVLAAADCGGLWRNVVGAAGRREVLPSC